MYDYNASHLNEQKTLLEEFHKIQRYLIEHPLYQIYQSSADYVAGVNEYYINEVAVREGGTLSVGDVVLFSNVYYGVITEINEETEMFTIAEGISFRGATGATGATGETGATGAPGQNGTDGRNGLSIYLYDGALNDTLTTAYVAQINVPTGYTVKTGDILFSTLETSYGAMSLVTSDADDVSTLVSIDYIGKVAGGSSDKAIRDIDGSITASALENISVSTGTASNGVAYIRAFMKGEVTYTNNTYDTINYYIDLPIKAGDGVTIEAQPLEGGTGNKQLVISASGGGTTLNEYNFSYAFSSSETVPESFFKRLHNIHQNAKGRVVAVRQNGFALNLVSTWDDRCEFAPSWNINTNDSTSSAGSKTLSYCEVLWYRMFKNAYPVYFSVNFKTGVSSAYTSRVNETWTIKYWNDVEITE